MKTLKSGIITKHVGVSTIKEGYEMRLITERELEEVVALQGFVYSKLPNKQVLYLDSYDEMMTDMRLGAKIIGVFNQDQDLIAYRYVGFPGYDNKNLGYDIKLPEKELSKVVHLETTVVHPDYRGNGLQSATLQEMIPVIKEMGYKHMLCTVSPQNYFSLFNIMKNGLKIKALKKKYEDVNNGKEGLWRFILHRNLEPISILNPRELLKTSINDMEKQERLIKEGFIGYWLFTESKELNYVRFDEGVLV
jgi:ribosomal protein S18 acetylase RimI-like enzyme